MSSEPATEVPHVVPVKPKRKKWKIVLVAIVLIVVVAGVSIAYWWFSRTRQTIQTTGQKAFGGYEEDSGKSVIQTSDGGYVVAGYTNSFGAGDDDMLLIRTDASGNLLWNKTYGGADNDSGYSIVQSRDGGYAIAGTTGYSGGGSGDVLLVKTDAGGNLLWTKTYGGAGDDYGYSLVQTSDGGYAIAGSTNSSGAGYEDVYLVKTDAEGELNT